MIGGAAEGLLVRPRIALALARDGLAPAVLARVDARGTPWAATLAHAAVVLALVATGTFTRLLLLLVLSQALAGLLEAASWFPIARRRAAVVPIAGGRGVAVLFTGVNAAACVAVAVESPASVAATVGAMAALLVAGAIVVRVRAARSCG